jgi:hypothetical protein
VEVIVKNIYVILSATPTMMGKFIRVLTRSSFNHSSISLTEGWEEMYSFARYRASNPLVGGFVREFPQRLSHGRDQGEVYIKVYKIPVSNKQYEKIKMFIYGIRDDSEENIYNTLAAIGIFLGHRVNTYKAYTCSDFVAQSLSMGKIISNSYVSRNIVPDEMQMFLDRYTVFSGCLKNYKPVANTCPESGEFYMRLGFVKEVTKTCLHFYNLIKRNNMANYFYVSGKSQQI